MSALDRLWAGWRHDYIAMPPRESAAPAAGDCVFCGILACEAPDSETHVIWRHSGGAAVALLNAYPYVSGHLLVLPTRHVADPEDLGDEESAAVGRGVMAATRAVKVAYEPDGLNVGANLGRAAGAGVPGHLHIHVLPRWEGDTNFMTSVADTRVLPEALSVSDERLRRAWSG